MRHGINVIRPRRLATLARALGALITLVILVAGIPLALARTAGWPLPAHWPAAGQVQEALRDGLGDTFWVKAFALIVWVAWLQVAWAVMAEVVASVRGRTVLHRPGMAWAQHLAGRLVGAVVLASGTVGHLPHAGAVAATPPAVAVQAAALASTPVAPGAVSVAVGAGATHVVVRGETLSSIAEDELGDDRAWPTIWDANQGRAYGTRVFDDPDLILPGWDLAVPIPPQAAPTPAEPPVVEAQLIPPLVIRAPDAPPTGTTTTTPASPTPTSLTTAPSIGSSSGVQATEPASGPSSASTTTQPVGVAMVSDAVAEDAPTWARLGALAGATLLATGVAGRLLSTRRRHLRGATAHSCVVPPAPEAAPTISAVAAGSDELAMARLELALRALAGQLARSGSESRPLAVRRRADALEILLDRPAALGAPWRPGRDDVRWELPATAALTELTDDARAVAPPCPALVGLGRDLDGAELFVDLEALGTLSVGEAPAAADALRLLAATLAVTPLADGLRLVVVGDDVAAVQGRHEVEVAPDLAAAIATAEAHTAAIARVTGGAPSTFRLRTVAGHESWEPVVVVLTEPVRDDADLARLRRLAESHRGVAVVGVGLPGAEHSVTGGSDGLVRLPVLDTPMRLHTLTADELHGIEAALTAADSLVTDDHAISGADPGPSLPTAVERPWTLMVRVLGPVDVVDRGGQPASFERAKALELVVWLAHHQQSATRAGARSALWELDVSNASFSNVVSEARRALARLATSPDGEDWIARTYVERLPLHDGVVLDADLVRDHLTRARALSGAAAVDELRRALALVRGAPYAGRSYLWTDAEALPSTLTLLVTTVAAELGRRLLDEDDAEGVFAATAVGLDVLPGHEELIALRLRAHALRDDRSALRREYASYEQAILADPWDGEPAPSLVALCRELLGREAPVPVAGD